VCPPWNSSTLDLGGFAKSILPLTPQNARGAGAVEQPWQMWLNVLSTGSGRRSSSVFTIPCRPSPKLNDHLESIPPVLTLPSDSFALACWPVSSPVDCEAMHFEILRAAFAALLLASCVQSSQLEKRKCLPANINAATRNMIQQKRFDGYEADPYDDGTGRITVGYGHMCSSETCSELPYKMPISKVREHHLPAQLIMAHFHAQTDAQALFDSDMQVPSSTNSLFILLC